MPVLVLPAVSAATGIVTSTVDTNAPGYDLVLLAHVAAAVVALAALVVAGGSALALRGALVRGEGVSEALLRYYRPGANWAGRVLFLVPVLGFALLAMSGGQWTVGDAWVSIGLAAWSVVAVLAEAVLWPAERRLQEAVSRLGRSAVAEEVEDVAGEDVSGDAGSGPPASGAQGLCLRTGVLGLGLGVVLVAAGVLMVAKP